MRDYRIAGLPSAIAEEARSTRRSPGYGHPVHEELATGTGPCRSCLGLFEVGVEDRLLLTYRPDFGEDAIGAPGPIFIHADECERFEGGTLPAGLKRLPLLVEGRTRDGRTVLSRRTAGEHADPLIREYLDEVAVDFVTLRHGQAGCFIATIDRG